MRKTLSVIFVLFLLTAILAFPTEIHAADTFLEGDYVYTISNGEATITDIYDMRLTGDVTVPDTLGGYPVTAIGEKAYHGCEITSIIIPDRVKSIGYAAFSNCDSLQSITIPYVGESKKTPTDTYQYPLGYLFGVIKGPNTIDTHQAYYANSLETTTSKNFQIPKSLKTVTVTGGYIPRGAFQQCSNLTQIILGEGITGIGDYAFAYCEGLTSIILPESVTSIGINAFLRCYGLKEIVIPGNVAKVDPNAFYACSNLTSVELQNGVTEIGQHAFAHCNKLTTIILPDSITKIGDSAFYSCTSLSSIEFPPALTTIEDGAFSNCSSLKDITIPATVNWIGADAFSGCAVQGTLTVSKPLTGSGESIFYQSSAEKVYYTGTWDQWCRLTFENLAENPMFYGKNLYIDGKLLEGDVVIPEGITEIGDYAFYNCSGITSVTIPDSVTKIGASAFFGCSGLTNVYFEGDLRDWCNITFEDEDANPLKIAGNLHVDGELLSGNVSIPDSVTVIGDYVFQGCKGVTAFVLHDKVTAIGNRSFKDCSDLTTVTVNDGVISIGDYAYAQCSKITTVTVGDGVQTIGNHAFYYCINLETVVLGDNVRTIGESAFRSDQMIKTLVLGKNLTNVGRDGFEGGYYLEELYYEGTIKTWCGITFGNINANPIRNADRVYFEGKPFSGEITIPEGIEVIPYAAFYGCDTITAVVIPYSVTSIENSAFSNCSELTSLVVEDAKVAIGGGAFADCTKLAVVDLGKCAVSLGDGAFRECKRIAEIVIPDSVASIGYNVFAECVGLENVIIGNGVTVIESSAFEKCINLSSITLGDGITQIGSNVFRDCSSSLMEVHYKGDLTGWCQIEFSGARSNPVSYGGKLYIDGQIVSGDLIIPENVTIIQEYAFYNYDNIVSLIVLDNVTEIGIEAFYDCDGLEVVIIGNGVTHINRSAFQNCDNLSAVLIGKGLTTLQGATFQNCNNLKEVLFTGDAPYFGANVFGGVTATVYVPAYNNTWTGSAIQNHGGTITWMSYIQVAVGDLNADGMVNNKDVEYLLWYTLFPEDYPVNQDVDFNKDGMVNNKDVEHLLWHTLFPEDYPLQ